MTYQDGVGDLARLWDLLPRLVGSRWQELEPQLLDTLELLAAAETDGDRDRLAVRVLRLCLPYEPLRMALKPAVRREVIRNEQGQAVKWAQTTGELTTAIERSSRPGGDQWLTANFEEHGASQPLRAGYSYDLAIGIEGSEPPPDTLAAERLTPLAQHGEEAEPAILTVDLLGDPGDADIVTVDPVLTLPRHGPSPDLARFRVTPRARAEGAAELTLHAVVSRDGAPIQVLTIGAAVAGQNAAAPDAPTSAARTAVRVRALGRPLAEDFIVNKPDASLFITGQQIVLTGCATQAFEAELPPWQELEEIAEGPRAVLREIANGVLEDGGPAHQAGVVIPQQVYEKYLAELVRAGTLMFRTLFFGPGATAKLKDLGHALLNFMQDDGPQWLEIVTRDPVIPWHLLAFQDPAAQAAADPSDILGLRHRISCLPMRPSIQQPSPARSLRTAQTPLRVVVAVNRDIDEHGGARRDLVEGQLTDWQQRADAGDGALVVTVAPEHQVRDVLAHGMPSGELIYFFCHAYQDEEPSRLGLRSICLEFTGRHVVSIMDLMLNTPLDQCFEAAPLVVLNACASARPTCSVYGSFLSYLMDHGARGVIGTEADIPPVLGAAWAQQFFARVLDGVPLADAVFEVTRDLARRDRNLLGLAYALHCDGRSLVWPAIPGPPLTLAAQS